MKKVRNSETDNASKTKLVRENFSKNTADKNSCNVSDDFIQLGQLLASARNKAGMTKEQVIEQLRIKNDVLDAIERGDIASVSLPKAFLRAFMREYCAFLGAENVWREYDRITANKAMEVKKTFPTFDEHKGEHKFYSVNISSKKSRAFFISFLLIVILLAIYFVYQLRGDIASQIISPAEIVMGLNPLDKVESEDPKVVEQKDNVESEDDESNPSDENHHVDNESAPQSSDDNAQAVDGNASKKLPTDSASFNWLDQEQQEGSISAKPVSPPAPQTTSLSPKRKEVVVVKALNVLWIRVTTPHRRIFQGLMKKGEVKSFDVESVPVIIRYGKGNKALVTWNGVESLVSHEASPITVKYTLEAR